VVAGAGETPPARVTDRGVLLDDAQPQVVCGLLLRGGVVAVVGGDRVKPFGVVYRVSVTGDPSSVKR
jgi:uncharacterized membrane protein (DUF441 family)